MILTYHSFSDCLPYLDMALSPSLFRKQVHYLSKTYSVQTLSDSLAAWKAAEGPRSDIAVITVDDGYADNFHPLIEAATKFHAPSTLFITTGCIDAAEPPPDIWLMLAIHYAAAESIALPEFGIAEMWIRTPTEKESAVREVSRSLRSLPGPRRHALVEKFIEKSGRGEFIRGLGRSMMLQWDQICLMHSAGVEIGAHTLTHPPLSRIDPAAAHEEIVASVRRVKEMVGVETRTFAYPYGAVDDVNAKVVEICANSGVKAAVMLVDGDAPGSDPFRIPRTMVTRDRSTNPWGSFSRAVWACELEGIVDIARNSTVVTASLMIGVYGRVTQYMVRRRFAWVWGSSWLAIVMCDGWF